MESMHFVFIERQYPGLVGFDPEAYEAIIKYKIIQRLVYNPLANRYLDLEDIRVLNEGEVEIGLIAPVEAADWWPLHDELMEAVH